ncbi:response regulator [Pseudoalteromonas lipolytica]|uniref:response regulator n=1 Tax=Pseudoalteromonas lipolytica TaxID=570156 RepID=UPI003A971AE8
MKILVVDDMPLMRHVLINMLRSLDYNDIIEATDGSQALELLEKQHFDLVITDLHMPKMDGKCLLNHIRETPEFDDLPVLMVTCEDSKQTVTDMIAAKVSGFIIKPFCLNTLQKQLSRIVKPA